MKRIFSLVLGFLLVINVIQYAGYLEPIFVNAETPYILSVETNDPEIYESDHPQLDFRLSFDDIIDQLPIEYQSAPYIEWKDNNTNIESTYCSSSEGRLYFNIELYLDMGILRYGDWHAFSVLYSDQNYGNNVVNTSENDYIYYRAWNKVANVSNEEVQSPDLTVWQKLLDGQSVPGYQIQQVEYRYEGYTLEGEPGSNIFYTDDAFDGYEDNYWVSRYWNGLPSGEEGAYTTIALASSTTWLTNEDIRVAQDNLNRYIGDEIASVPASQRVTYDKQVLPQNEYLGSYQFINAQGIPTAYTSERKKVYHYENINSRGEGLWYETFNLDRASEQIAPPLNVSVEIEDKQSVKNQIYALNEGDDVVLPEVTIYMAIADDFVYNINDKPEGVSDEDWILSKRALIWDREDWDHFVVNIDKGGLTQSEAYKSNYSVDFDLSDPNEYFTMDGSIGILKIYDMKVPQNLIGEDGNLMVSVEAKAVFAPDNVETNWADAFDSVDDVGLLSRFTTATSINVLNPSKITSEKVRYQDQSRGDISNYSYEVYYQQDVSQSTSFSVNTMNETYVGSQIASFLKLVSNNETLGLSDEEIAGTTLSFRVIQTVSSSTGLTDTWEQAINVNFGDTELVEVIPNIDIPDEIWDIEDLNIVDNTDLTNLKELFVEIDGHILTPSEEVTFFSGDWNFGLKTNDTFHLVGVTYTSVDDITIEFKKHVKVKSTLPRASLTFDGKLKENRKITMTDFTSSSTSAELMAAFPITNREWSVETLDGDPISFYEPLTTATSRSMQSSSPGHYRVSLTVTNAAGRTGSTSYEFYVMPDYKADIVLNGWNFPAMKRDEALDLYASVQSLDGDNIILSRAEIWTDNNLDGELDPDQEELLYSFDFDEFMSKVNNDEISLTELGQYSFRISAIEEFGEDYIPELLTDGATTLTEVTDSIKVQNIRPLSQIFVDDMAEYPAANVMVLMDPSIGTEGVGVVNQEVVNMQNYLIENGINASVNDVDLTTYTYSEDIDTSVYYGATYPPSEIEYTAGAKSGILPRYNVVDNDYQSARTGTKSVYTSTSASTTKPNTEKVYYKKNASGNWYISGTDNPQLANSISYTSGTLSGTLYKTGSKKGSDNGAPTASTPGTSYTRTVYWTAIYSGTISGYVSEPYTYYVTVHRYTGYYAGPIVEIVKQDLYHNFTFEADKYIVYVSNDTVNVPDDLYTMQLWGNANLILIGNEDIESIEHYSKIDVSNIKDNIYEAMDVIIGDMPYNPNQVMLILGEDTIDSIFTDDFDYDGDPVTKEYWQVVHDQTVFDNPLGQDVNTVSSFDDTNYVEGPLQLPSFTKPGKLTFNRLAADQPAEGDEFSLFSNLAKLIVMVVRRPVALFNLDWKFNEITGFFEVKFEDGGSYSPDYQISRIDKGIDSVKVSWFDVLEPSSIYYAEPESWEPGHTYTVSYSSVDIRGLQSIIVTKTYTMPAVPPIQFSAEARTMDSRFNLSSVPAREFLELYDIWTRHPYDHYLEVGIYDATGNTLLSPITTVNYVEGVTGTKVDQDITWNNIMINIPEDLSDGDYILRITAREVVGSQYSPLEFDVTVYTPIWENYETGDLLGIENPVSNVPLTYLHNEETWIEFYTSSYTEKVSMEFDGMTYYLLDNGNFSINEDGADATFYQNNAYMTLDNFTVTDNGHVKTWKYQLVVKDTVEEATYSIIFNGYDASGNYTTSGNKHGYNPQSVNVDVMNLDLMDLRMTYITDKDFKYLFEYENGNRRTFSIPDEEFAVYQNTKREMIALGYRVDFKIDSVGLNMAADTISVRPSYYLLEDDGTLRLVDLYVKSQNGQYEKSSTTSLATKLNLITLTQLNRDLYEADTSDTNRNTWDFSIQIPYSTRFVPKGDVYDELSYELAGKRLLVTFDIEANKASNGGKLNYTLENADWCSESDVSYGFSKKTNQDLLGLGINHGEVLWFDTVNTWKEDVNMDREW